MAETIHVVFDMDGVLVKYDPAVYADPACIWERPNAHYFLNLPADRKALVLARQMAREPGCEISVCSRTSRMISTAIGEEQYRDKRAWCDRVIRPQMEVRDVVVTQWRKEDAIAMSLGRDINRLDVLIDDFNSNLSGWEHAGGTAIKWLNGVNNVSSWQGASLDPKYMTLDQMVTTIIREAKRPYRDRHI